MKLLSTLSILSSVLVFTPSAGQKNEAAQKSAAGRLEIREAGAGALRITLLPEGYGEGLPYTPALAEREYPAPALTAGPDFTPDTRKIGNLTAEVLPDPLRVLITRSDGSRVQELVFDDRGGFTFITSGRPVLGMGEGGPRPERGTDWRKAPVQFDRNGFFHPMIPRWQSDAYGSRNPVAMMIGTDGWAIFVATPWGQVDLREKGKGIFTPQDRSADTLTQNTANQQLNQGKGLPPADKWVKGLLDIFVFDAADPQLFMKEVSVLTGPAAMPPRWALGYMQSHRTLENDDQMISIIDTFRQKMIPIDAVIYLGTGFCPRGWNTPQPSFDFNPEVFRRNPEEVLEDLHKRNVKVVVHIVPWDRDRLSTLHGNIPALPGEMTDSSHIQNYWAQHVSLAQKGIDGFWPDEGDWFNLWERMKRHQLYYQGPLSLRPDTRPWSLQRNGHLGIARWGSWVWSGDTESSWKTLEAQIAVGINYSLSVGPYWGSDIGGFYPNNEKTGELYARWFQFGAFCGSFRSHGRTWHTALPWGWGLTDMGPREDNNRNTPARDTDRRNPLVSELNNPLIEPVVKKYDELRYMLLPYTYTLAWEARSEGMPLMRAMWLEFPGDTLAAVKGDQYMWGPDMLISPVYEKGAVSRTSYLPAGNWYDWWSGEKLAGGRNVTRDVDLSIMPVYVREGAIIPVDPVRQYTGQEVSEPTTLKIFTGSDGSFTLYDDDGTSQQYLSGKGTWIKCEWNEKRQTLTLSPGTPSGMTGLPVERDFIVSLVPDGRSKKVSYENRKVKVRF